MNKDLPIDCEACIGIDVEQGVMQGTLTLYVRGKPSIKWVSRFCDVAQELPQLREFLPLRHLYFGAEASFDGRDVAHWAASIRYFLQEQYWVTLELHPRRIPALVQTKLCTSARFIPLVSVPIPCIKHLGTNAALRIADLGVALSNTGTWRYQLRSLINTSDAYTPWSYYRATIPVILKE